MPTVERSALVPFRNDDMYALVIDVAAYPEFLPWCAGGQVQSQTDIEQLASVSLNVVFKQTEFRTRNTLQPGHAVLMALEDGPFNTLTGEWGFKPLGDAGCKVSLRVDFEFSSPVLARAIQPAFTRVCDTLVDAFIRRAHDKLVPLS